MKFIYSTISIYMRHKWRIASIRMRGEYIRTTYTRKVFESFREKKCLKLFLKLFCVKFSINFSAVYTLWKLSAPYTISYWGFINAWVQKFYFLFCIVFKGLYRGSVLLAICVCNVYNGKNSAKLLGWIKYSVINISPSVHVK